MKYSLFTIALAAVAMSAQAETIVIKGSDTLGAKLVPQLAEVYKKSHPGVTFEIAAEGSATAFTALNSGSAHIGLSSREIKADEKANLVKNAKSWLAGRDMLSVVVNKNNPVSSLTSKQIEGIFTGKITDWSEVGGSGGKISVYTRNTASGTYASFQEMAMSKKDYGSNCQKMAGNEQIVQEVGRNAAGIGYVGLAYTKAAGVKKVAVNGVEASPENFRKYKISRSLYYYTAGMPTGEVKNFLEWATTSPEAKAVVAQVGFLAP